MLKKQAGLGGGGGRQVKLGVGGIWGKSFSHAEGGAQQVLR